MRLPYEFIENVIIIIIIIIIIIKNRAGTDTSNASTINVQCK